MANLPEMTDYLKSVGLIIAEDAGSKEGHASMSIAASAATSPYVDSPAAAVLGGQARYWVVPLRYLGEVFF